MKSPFPLWTDGTNDALDALFYDVAVLSDLEKVRLADCRKVEGMVLEVGPSSDPTLRYWDNIAACGGLAEHYPAISVAGVGSSAVGAAALARNVADAFGETVLSVVSGYGMTDLASEAMGGYFLFGSLNAIRHTVQSFEALSPFPAFGFSAPDPGQPFHLARHSDDVKALTALLGGRVSTDWLIGHSKGNLVISEALYGMREKDAAHFDDVAHRMGTITFSARIAMPREIETVIDVMGTMDGLGALNSRLDIPVDIVVPNAWHHTNTKLLWHLPVTKVLKGILGTR